MPRYLRQPHATTCGPTVVVNAIKWAGGRANRRTYDFYRGMCASPGSLGGTYMPDFKRALAFASQGLFNYEEGPCSIRRVARHLARGGAVIARYDWDAFTLSHPGPSRSGRLHGAHFTLVIGGDGETFTLVNNDRRKTLKRVSRRTLKAYLRPKASFGKRPTNVFYLVRKG